MDHRPLLALQLLFKPCERTLVWRVTLVPTPIAVSPSPPWIMDSVWKGRSSEVCAWKLWSVRWLDEQFHKHRCHAGAQPKRCKRWQPHIPNMRLVAWVHPLSVFTAIAWRVESTACLSTHLTSFQAETSGRLAQWLSTCTVGTQDRVGSDNVFQISKEILSVGLF